MGLHAPTTPHTRTINAPASFTMRGIPQGFTLLVGDVLTGAFAYLVSNALLGLTGRPGLSLATAATWLSLWLLWRAYQGLYPGYGRSPQNELRLHVVGTLQVAVAQFAAAVAIQRFAPTIFGVGLEWLLILLLALPVRYGVRALLIRGGAFGRPVSIIGAGKTAALTIAHLLEHPGYGLRPVVAYDDNPALWGTSLHGVPVRGTLEEALVSPVTGHAIVTIPGARAELQRDIVNGVYATYPITWAVPDLFGVPNQALQPHNIGAIASLEIRNNLRSMRARFVKRTLDLAGALFGGLLISPVLLVIALAIRLDSPGPIVYRARRLGRDGRPFDCFKFRSMHRDAEAKLQAVLDADPALRAEFEATHKLKNDPRVTRVGALLRKTSLDELAQLLNVLIGDMSLVGPRPIVQAEVVKYGDAYAVYRQVRPGMTGYWQANGRSDTSYAERVSMDQFYVTNWTPWLDLVIMLQTVRVVLVGKGAY